MCRLNCFVKSIEFFRFFPTFQTNSIWFIIKIFYLQYEKTLASCIKLFLISKQTRNQKWSANVSAIFNSFPRTLNTRIISLCVWMHKMHWSEIIYIFWTLFSPVQSDFIQLFNSIYPAFKQPDKQLSNVKVTHSIALIRWCFECTESIGMQLFDHLIIS